MEHMTSALRAEYTRVAYYYHKVGLTQEQISQKMHMSRQRVNRILKACVEQGIVKISIEGAESVYYELEASLEQKFGLRAARVAEPCEPEIVNTVLGGLAGTYLAEILSAGDIIGFSRGQAMSALADNMPTVTKSGLVVTQLIGGWNHAHPAVNVDEIIHRFSRKVGATAKVLFAPAWVHSAELRRSIMAEPYFLEAYKIIQSCTIAVVGVGGMASDTQTPNRQSIAREEALQAYAEQGAVGEVCAHFFDIEGRPVRSDLDERIIAISREDYFRIPLRIGVAGTPAKVPAITGALRGGYVNVLITDLSAAEALERL